MGRWFHLWFGAVSYGTLGLGGSGKCPTDLSWLLRGGIFGFPSTGTETGSSRIASSSICHLRLKFRSGWVDDGWRIPRVWCDKSCGRPCKLKIRKKCCPVNIILWGLLPPSMEAKNWSLQLSFLSSMTVKVPFLMEIVTRICFGSIDGWCWCRYRRYMWRSWELAQNSSFMKRMMWSCCCIGPSMMCYLNVIWSVSTVVVGLGQYQAGLSSFLGVELSSERLNRTKQLAKPIDNMTREAKGHRIAKRIGEKGPRMQFSNAIHLRMMHVFWVFVAIRFVIE